MKKPPSFDAYLDHQIDEHTKPEPTTWMHCVHCERETESAEDLQTCGGCYRPYRMDKDDLLEAYEGRIAELETTVREMCSMVNRYAELREDIESAETRPCVNCGVKPSLRTSLSCEDCVEGGIK